MPMMSAIDEIRATTLYRELFKLVQHQERTEGPGFGLPEVLADLRHIADVLGQDFNEASEMGLASYLGEIETT